MGCESVETACDINQIFVPDIAQISIGSKHFVTEPKVFEMKRNIDVLLRFKANNFAIIEVNLHKNDLREELTIHQFFEICTKSTVGRYRGELPKYFFKTSLHQKMFTVWWLASGIIW